MSTESVCIHYKFGFCKYGNNCRKRHIEERCESSECDASHCQKRHPRACKYFSEFNRCKFGDYCDYLHKIPANPVIEELKLLKGKIEAIEKEINVKNSEINQVLLRIEASIRSKTSETTVESNQESFTAPVSITPSMSLPVITTSPMFPDRIPQLDGSQPQPPPNNGGHQHLDISPLSQPNQSGNKCENCGKIFDDERNLKEHLDTHEFGCDDCYTCYKTKFHVDLHELEKHPDSAYAQNHIPYTTKLQFAAGCRVPSF